ncbi:MAG: DNA-3-methyladenine glycosylase I [Castellaniella sp.]|nr:MAG: DNA-3-methyladenine glycosylase I [Castellaniella sp.]
MHRCAWCSDDPLYIRYHDEEWGVPSYDPDHLFELLLLEGFQAGLSWITILRKREAFREALLGFDPRALAATDATWVQDRMGNPAIIRNRLKLEAAGRNARAWLAIPDPVGLIWSVVDGRPLTHRYTTSADIPAAGPEAQVLSKRLKKLGFTFVGPTICHSYLQAIGCLMDHTTDCDRYRTLADAAMPTHPHAPLRIGQH